MGMITIVEDFEDVSYNFGFTGSWIRTTSTPYAGSYCFKNNVITHGQSTSCNFTINIPANATTPLMSLWYRVSSENNYDWLRILVNGVELVKKSGTVSWTLFSTSLNVGSNSVEFRYTKDGSGSTGEDAGFIDDLAVAYNIPENHVKSVPDTLSLADLLSKKAKPSNNDSLSIVDDILSRFIASGFDVSRFDFAKFDETILPLNVFDDISLADLIENKVSVLKDDTISISDLFSNKISISKTDTLTLADTLINKLQALKDDSLSLVDEIGFSRKIIFDEAINIVEALANKVSMSKDDVLSLSDQLLNKISVLVNEASLPLSDNVFKKNILQIAETISFADSVLKFHAILKNDDLILLDEQYISTKRNIVDMLCLESFANLGVSSSDIVSKNIKPLITDSISMLDTLVSGIYSYKSDVLILADSIASISRLNKSDVLILLDNIASSVAKGDTNEAITISDELFKKTALLNDSDILSTLTDEIKSKVGLNSSENISTAEMLVVLVAKSVFSTLDLLDDIIKQANDTQSELLSSMDATALRVGKTLSDTANVLESLAIKAGISVDDVSNIVEQILIKIGKSEEEAIMIADTLATKAGLNSSEITMLADSLAIKANLSLNDTMSLSESIVKSLNKLYIESISTTDDFNFKISKTIADTLSVNDTISFNMSVLYGDICGIADVLYKMMKNEVHRSYFDIGTFDVATFDNTGDLLTISDNVSIEMRLSKVLDDIQTISDNIYKKINKQFDEVANVVDVIYKLFTRAVDEDTLTLEDYILLASTSLNIENIPTSEQVAKYIKSNLPQVGVFDGTMFDMSYFDSVDGDDTLVLDEYAIAMTFKRFFDEIISISDFIDAKTNKQLETVLSIDDVITKYMKITKSDSISFLDEYKLKAETSYAELASLSDQLINKAKAFINDDVVVSENVLKALFILTSEIINSEDSLSIKSGRVIAEILNLSDEFLFKVGIFYNNIISVIESVNKSAKIQQEEVQMIIDDSVANFIKKLQDDGYTMSDELIKLMGIKNASLLSLLDSHANVMDSNGSNDINIVTDTIVAALIMTRSYTDTAMLVDSINKSLKKLTDEILLLSDSVYVGMQSAKQEVVDLADLLGIFIDKQANPDLIGVLDEATIRAMLRIDEDTLGLADKIKGVKFKVLQQVFINGVQVPVADLHISHSADDRISTCTFKIHSPSPQVLSMAKQRADVKVYLADGDGYTDYFRGRIVDNPITPRSALSKEITITCEDYTGVCNNIFVGEVYEETDGTLTDILKDMWNKYFPYEFLMSGVIDSDKTVDILSFNYVTLFEATEKIAQLLGWVWFVDWNNSDLVLRFYPPESAIKPIVLSAANRNVVANTARFGKNDKIINSVHLFGGTLKSTPYTHYQEADGQKLEYSLPYKPYRTSDLDTGGITITVDSVPKTVGVLNLHDASDYDVLVDFNNSLLIFKVKPAKSSVIATTFCYGYPILIHMTDDNSIAQYGLHETKIVDTKIKSIQLARETAKQILRDYAVPSGYGSCEVYVEGLRAGDFITVDMPEYDTTGLFEIIEIQKWIEKSKTKRRISLNVADNVEDRIAQRLKDFAKRISQLEEMNTPENTIVQRCISGNVKNVGVSVIGSFSAEIKDSQNDNQDIDDYFCTTHKSGTTIKTNYATDKAVPADKYAIKAKLRKPESSTTLKEHVAVGMSFFDISVFDDNAGFGLEVSS